MKMFRFADKYEWVAEPCINWGSMSLRMLGPALCTGLYIIVYMHAKCYFQYILPLLPSRLGIELSLLWTAIGLTILYNICFNHFLAMTIKPGSPRDLLKTEGLRKHYKERATRKEV